MSALDAPHAASDSAAHGATRMPRQRTAIVNRGPSQQPHRGADPADAVCLSSAEVAALAARGVLDDHRMIRHLRKSAMGAISGLDRGMQVRAGSNPPSHLPDASGLCSHIGGVWEGRRTLEDDPVIAYLRPHLPPAIAKLGTITGCEWAGGVGPQSRCSRVLGVSQFR